MAWDTARTKQLLLEAAVEEFAEHGPQGARVARIATRAGVNKERIYQYFGNKDQLFDAVLEAELANLAAAVPLTADQAADLGDYVGQVVDYHRLHPHFLRLLAWEGLQCGGAEHDPVVAESRRARHYAEKVDAISQAQRTGAVTGEVDAALLMYAVIALAAAWFTMPQLVRMLLTGTPSEDPAAQREALVALVRRLTAA